MCGLSVTRSECRQLGAEFVADVSESTPVPRPSDWARLHQLLEVAWKSGDRSAVPEPPVPLILAGAAFSTASEIRQRWIDLVRWANSHGYADLLFANLPPPPDIDVAGRIAGAPETRKRG